MPADVDKAYIKKNKINDLLNDLFSVLTQNKPENPIEFSIKHLQSKLPPTLPPPLIQINDNSTNNLLSTLFNKTVGNESGAHDKSGSFQNTPITNIVVSFLFYF